VLTGARTGGTIVALAEVTFALDASPSSLATQRFDAWGNLQSTTGGSIATYGYTGREPDASGLTYYRARYYHPVYGQFTSRDPIGLQGGINPYAYVNGNPISFNDPSGLLARQVGNSVVGYTGRVTDSVSSFASGLDIVGAADQFGRKLATDFVDNQKGSFGAQAWLADKLTPYAQGYDGSTPNGQLAAGLAIGATFLTPAGEIQEIKALKRGGETAATITGREAHKAYENTLGGGYEFNKALPSGKRPDATDFANNIVRELKPDSNSGISRGLKQLQGYVDELEAVTKQKWQGFLDTYNRRP